MNHVDSVFRLRAEGWPPAAYRLRREKGTVFGVEKTAAPEIETHGAFNSFSIQDQFLRNKAGLLKI